MNRFNQEIFNQNSIRNIQCRSPNCHLDDEVKNLTDCLISFLNEQVLIQEKRVKKESQIKWMNDNLLGLMKERDYLKKIWLHTSLQTCQEQSGISHTKCKTATLQEMY